MIVLMGLAGAGKSTQGKMLAEATGRVWISAGQVLRETGKYDAIMHTGQLVDDELVVKLMAEEMARVTRSGRDAILDGFPRDVYQANWVVENIVQVIKKVVRIDVPKEELIERLLARGRADDTREAITKRFEIVEQNICSVCDILEKAGVEIVRIDGTGTPEEVFRRLMEATKERKAENE